MMIQMFMAWTSWIPIQPDPDGWSIPADTTSITAMSRRIGRTAYSGLALDLARTIADLAPN